MSISDKKEITCYNHNSLTSFGSNPKSVITNKSTTCTKTDVSSAVKQELQSDSINSKKTRKKILEFSKESFHASTPSLPKDDSRLHSLINSLYDNVLVKMEKAKKERNAEVKVRSKSIGCLSNDLTQSKQKLEDAEREIYEKYIDNNSIQFVRARIQVENSHNENELSELGEKIPKLKNNIEKYTKLARDTHYEYIEEKNDLKMKSLKCKELSAQIALGIEAKKTLVSGLLQQRNKNERLKHLLGCLINKENIVSDDISGLIHEYNLE